MELVPNLRFDGFREEWIKKQYEDIYSFHSTNSFSRALLNYEEGEVKNIHYGDIHTKFSTLFDIEIEDVPFINLDVDLTKIKKNNYCKEGDLVVADASEDYLEIGKTIEINKLHGDKVLAGLHTFLARPDKYKMAIGFAGFLMQSSSFRKQIMLIAQGTKVLSISTGRLAKVELIIPSFPEQQKIASFFTTIDQKITQLTQKVEALEHYKKGVVQKLFSQGIRFKDENGKDFPEWEVFSLSKFLEYSSKGVSKPKENYLSIGVRSHGRGTFQKPNISPEDNLMDILYQIEPKDLIVNITFAWEGAIAIVQNRDKGGFVSHRFPTYRFDERLCLSDYFQYVIVQRKFKHLLDLISPGGAGRNRVLSKKEFLKLKVLLPRIEEQRKIANFIMSLDTKIHQSKSQLKQTKLWKKGLLQKMFV